ncbi:hypothetical protein [Streptomyces sp. NPDC056527]|uniref:hypothetical protein n=1 Tax=Streptomyces sp. NPDC056527 TaxID=3345853 RepID=UPI00367FAC4A
MITLVMMASRSDTPLATGVVRRQCAPRRRSGKRVGTMPGDMRDVLCWRGPVSVNVFVIGSGNTPLPKEAFHLAEMVPDAFLPFPLLGQPEAVERLGLVSYDIDFDDVSLDLREYTRAALRRVCADTRAVAWAAFEGSFHYDELLTDQVAHQVYGYCATGAEPVVEWDTAALRGEEWRRRIAEARGALEALLSASEIRHGKVLGTGARSEREEHVEAAL